MKIRRTGFCMPVPNECLALKREAVFKNSTHLWNALGAPSAAPFKAG